MRARSRAGVHARVGLCGLLLGYAIARTGFADWGEIHRMFTLVDARLLLTFAGAVLLSGVGFALFARHGLPIIRPVRRGTVPGGVLFGVGWAITGACPVAALVQLGQGYVVTLATCAGISIGGLLYQRVAAPYLQWDVDACG